jgi:hypothetical protein
MRKVYVTVEVRLIIEQNDGVETAEIIDELDYHFSDTTDKATVVDSEILDYEVTDSK